MIIYDYTLQTVVTKKLKKGIKSKFPIRIILHFAVC